MIKLGTKAETLRNLQKSHRRESLNQSTVLADYNQPK